MTSSIGEKLASMNVPFKDITEYLIKLCEEKGDIAGIKFYRKSKGKRK